MHSEEQTVSRLLANCYPDYFTRSLKENRVCRLKIDPLTTEACEAIVEEYQNKLLPKSVEGKRNDVGHSGLDTHVTFTAYNKEFVNFIGTNEGKEFNLPDEVLNKLSFIEDKDRAFWAVTAIRAGGYLLPHYDEKRQNLGKTTIVFPVIIDPSHEYSPIEIYTDEKIFCTDKRIPCAVNITKLHGVFNLTPNTRYNIHLRLRIPYTDFVQKYSEYVEW